MSESERPPGTIIAGKYELRGLLGAGGVGAVYAATNIAIGRRVAIKFLGPELRDREDLKARFDMEARASAAIDHPGIVDVLDQGETATGDPFIVMEHLQGATLRAVLKALGAFSVGQVVAVMGPVLDALGAAHRVNIIHRDIKPANIFICARPAFGVKVLDFGISWFGESSGLTLEGTAVGTPRYMAPEQVLGETLGPETDLYAVGASIYQLVSGKPPFEGMSDMATLARLLTAPPEPLRGLRPDLDPAFCAFVERLMNRDRHARPQDAAVAAAELRAFAAPDVDAIFAAASNAADDESKRTPLPSPSSPGLRRGGSGSGTGGSRQPPAPMPAPADRTATLASPSRPSAVPRHPESLAPPPAAAPAPTSRRAPVVLGALGAVGVVVVLAVVFWPKPAVVVVPPPVVAPPVVVAPVPAPVPAAVPADPNPFAGEKADVSLTVQLDPPSARLSGDGLAECNPCVVTRARGQRQVLKATAPGYATVEVALEFDQARTERVVLVPTHPNTVKPPPGKKKNTSLNMQEKNPYE